MKPTRNLPMPDWLVGYRRTDLAGDMTAGIITAIMLVPQGMAYALLAGLPPQVGLYASIVPLVLYAMLGSSRTLAVGPVALVSLLVASSAGAIADQGSEAYHQVALTLAFLVGLLSVLFGLLRAGFLVNFLSHPVISGFTSAAALVIGFSQLRHLLGIDIPRTHNIAEILANAFEARGEVGVSTVGIGVAAIALLLVARGPLTRALTRVGLPAQSAQSVARAGPLFMVILTTLTVGILGLDTQAGVKTVGAIPAGLPPLSGPTLTLDLLQDLLPAAFLIAFVGFLESVSVAKALASKRRQKIDANRELIGLGSANLGAAFTGGYPVTGGFSRSSVNFEAGANTPLASIITALFVALTVLLLTPLFYHLPKAALAAIIIVAVSGLIDLRTLRTAWAYNKADAISLVATFAAVLVLGVEPGIVAGIIVSLGLFLWRTAEPHFAIVGRVGTSEHFRNIKRHDVRTCPRILAIRIDESLYFANARFLETTILAEVAERRELEHVVLICSAVNVIDTSALESLHTLIHELRDAGVTLHLAEVKGPVMDRLRRTDLLDQLKPGRVFLSTHEAMETLERMPAHQRPGRRRPMGKR